MSLPDYSEIAVKAAAVDLSAPVSSKSLTDLLARCFAATKAVLGLTPFPSQIEAAVHLNEHCAVEMDTGEGKTLSAVFAAFLSLQKGEKVHVLTFNDYLAKRDAKWMKPVYDLLGVSVAYVTAATKQSERRALYQSDVVYTTVKEAGFDYLKGFLAETESDRTLIQLPFAIFDEADSILIDEARLPLIVAGDVDTSEDDVPYDFNAMLTLIDTLTADDYRLTDDKAGVYLTDKGAEKAEEFLNVDNIYNEEQGTLLAVLTECLKARFILLENKQYIVKDGVIRIIDEFTGRAVRDRSYPGLLQGALEAKHGIKSTTRGAVLAGIPVQYFARLYKSLAGMSGTILSSEEEFELLYGLKCVRVEPHTASVQIHHGVKLYYNDKIKLDKILDTIEAAQKRGQPVLVGTKNIDESERVAELLKEREVTDVVLLNAKNDEREAEIIKNAGAPFAVTITTNMAGRGVDIPLGGANGERYAEAAGQGGLLVIVTSMRESRRIERQLSGRAGRQGDPGESVVFVSLDDEIMTACGFRKLVPPNKYPDYTEEQLTDKVLLRETERVRRIAAGNVYDKRTRLMKFTAINEKHRAAVFSSRERFLTREQTPDFWSRLDKAQLDDIAKRFGKEQAVETERLTALLSLNVMWREYTAFSEELRSGIHLMSVGGKSPAEEYNIICEEHFASLEPQLDEIMLERLTSLSACENISDYTLERPKNIRTYLQEDNGDELVKKPLLLNLVAEAEGEVEETPIVESEPIKAEKKGFFSRLTGKK
ncbi:MAG: DEAD/DEAH box helicase [Oscillospiraceae bacterium]|jgi:preprotein translocase subunit SecA|nr:DEAD/DEAH box helicase [Oscillospiraceae bacterium]